MVLETLKSTKYEYEIQNHVEVYFLGFFLFKFIIQNLMENG